MHAPPYPDHLGLWIVFFLVIVVVVIGGYVVRWWFRRSALPAPQRVAEPPNPSEVTDLIAPLPLSVTRSTYTSLAFTLISVRPHPEKAARQPSQRMRPITPPPCRDSARNRSSSSATGICDRSIAAPTAISASW